MANGESFIDDAARGIKQKVKDVVYDRGSVSMPAPYAVLVEPVESSPGSGKTYDGRDYQKAMLKYTMNVSEMEKPSTFTNQMSELTNKYTPKIRVNDSGTGFVLSGTREALKSSVADELRNTLKDTFQYSDLKSKSVAEAIDKLNESVKDQIGKSIVDLSVGGDYDEYKKYANAIETMKRQNPMALEGDDARKKYGIWGYDREGNKKKLLPKEWIELYRKEFNATERANLYATAQELFAIQEPGEHYRDYLLLTPYLVMSGGKDFGEESENDRPIYGFDAGDDIEAFFSTLSNELLKGAKGISEIEKNIGSFIVNAPGYLRKNHLNDMAHDLGHADDVSPNEVPWISEKEYDKKIESLNGKKISDLTKDEQAFLATALNDNPTYATSSVLANDNMGRITDLEYDEIGTPSDTGIINSDKLKNYVSYTQYINARDNLSTTTKYDEELEGVENYGGIFTNLEDEVNAASIYSPVSVGTGTAIGTVLRMLAESGAISTLTGGAVNPANLGDDLAEGILKISAAGSKVAGTAGGVTRALNSPIGKFLLTLATEVPEDVLQTAIDNVVIGNAEENPSLLTPGNIADNTLQNLMFRMAFGLGGKVVEWGMNVKDYVNNRRLIKRIAGQSGITSVDPDVLYGEYAEVKNALDAGRGIGFDENGHAIITDENGNTKTLENVTPTVFQNTGDSKLDAIGDAWKKAHPNTSSNGVDASKYYGGVQTSAKSAEDAYADFANENVKMRYPDAESNPQTYLNGVSDDNILAIGEKLARQTEYIPGGYLDEVNPSLRSGDKTIKDLANEIVDYGKKIDNPLASNEKAVDGIVDFFSNGNAYLNNDTILYRFISKDGNFVNRAGDFSWADTGIFNDNGIASTTMWPSELEKVYSGEGENVMLRYHLPDGQNIILLGGDNGSYRTGAAQGEVLLPPMKDGKVVKSNEFTPDGAEIYDVYFGSTKAGAMSDNIDDIVGRKNTKTLGPDTPDSASSEWDTPRIRKSYYSNGYSTAETTKFAIADLPDDATQLPNWYLNSTESVMESYRANFVPEFERVYPTPEDRSAFVRNMDYTFHLQKNEKLALEDCIGKRYIADGMEYTVSKEDIDFYKNTVEPQMEALREASQAALGVDIPTTVGYLPHTDYSPNLQTSEELIQGTLWKHYGGGSVLVDGNFNTSKLSDSMEARYRTFAENMLWDAAGERVAAWKLMEEFHADGVDVTAEQAESIVRSKKSQADLLEKSPGGKITKKNAHDTKHISHEEIEKAIEESSGGWSQRIHDGYKGTYGQATGTYAQPILTRTRSNSDWMRKMQTPDGSLYDNGGRMVMAGDADAYYLAKRIFDENLTGKQVKDIFVEYLTQGGRRTVKGAEYIADTWMKRLVEKAGNSPVTKASLSADLNSLIYFEGVSRVNRWIARADLSQFAKKNLNALDSFVYRQGLISRQLNDSGVMSKLNKAANTLISLRAKSLFWGNFKNGVLQTSECIRLFTEFELGDALKTIKRLATNLDFQAEVDEWLAMTVPRSFGKAVAEGNDVSRINRATADAMNKIASKSSYKSGVLNVDKLSAQDLKDLAKSFDEFASSPVEFGERMKNRVLMAGILQEAQRRGLTGNELFNYVNKRFERIGLAANDMGKLVASDNPFFRLATNLQTFGIREANMFVYNIVDANADKGIGGAITYIIKNLGWKGGLLLVMTKLGYGALSVLGVDPFGLMDDQYTGVDEEDYNWLDRVVTNPITNALFSGGFTSYMPKIYRASRQAYEGQVSTVEGAERALDENRQSFGYGWNEFGGLSWDDIRNIGIGFIPGYTQAQRVITMNDLINRGWAIGQTGLKKYEAPTNPFDIASGYIFGASNTPQARAYNQTPDFLQGFIDNGFAGVGQQIGRVFGGYRQFDPIDTENYYDWFSGTSADEAQWRSGYYYFKKKADNVLNDYAEKTRNAYSDSDRQALRDSYNSQIRELEQQLKAFTDAYTAKNPNGFNEEKMNNLLAIINTNMPDMNATDSEQYEQSMENWNRALSRYSQAGLPAITTFRGTDKGAETVHSPQYRAAVQGKYGLPKEAASRIEELYKDKWKKLNQQYRDKYYNTKGSKAKKTIQNEYIRLVRQDLDPIVKLYGGEIFQNDTVEDIVEDVFNSMVPKYGQTAKSYLKNLYKDYHGTIRYSETGNQTLTQITGLINQGKKAQAKALARTLLQRVQENRTSLSRAELERLQKVLND